MGYFLLIYSECAELQLGVHKVCARIVQNRDVL